MKQLSLLVLAGLTTGCFAAEEASCWNVIHELAAHPDKVNTMHLMAGLADCSNRHEQIKRLENDTNLRPSYKKALGMVASYLAFVSGIDTLEAAIERDEAMIQEFLARTQYVEAEDEELKAGLAKARSHLNLIEETKEVDARPKAIITDPSFLAESKEIIENKTRELKARKPIIS